MSDLYHATLQNDEVSEGGINPYIKDRCVDCIYCENRKGKVSINVYYCTLKKKFISSHSVSYDCFRTKINKL